MNITRNDWLNHLNGSPAIAERAKKMSVSLYKTRKLDSLNNNQLNALAMVMGFSKGVK
jgi:hypothetical protein